MNLRDEFNTITNGKYEHLTSDSDITLLCKESRYIDFLESKIKKANKTMQESESS